MMIQPTRLYRFLGQQMEYVETTIASSGSAFRSSFVSQLTMAVQATYWSCWRRASIKTQCSMCLQLWWCYKSATGYQKSKEINGKKKKKKKSTTAAAAAEKEPGNKPSRRSIKAARTNNFWFFIGRNLLPCIQKSSLVIYGRWWCRETPAAARHSSL